MTKRPTRVTLTLWLVLSIIAWNCARVWTAIAWRQILGEYSAKPGPFYLAASGTLWILTGIFVLWSMLRRTTWTGTLLMGIAIGYSVWYWTDRTLWQVPRPNWLFASALNAALLFFIFFTTKSLSRETHER
jgi:hypothetical protein